MSRLRNQQVWPEMVQASANLALGSTESSRITYECELIVAARVQERAGLGRIKSRNEQVWEGASPGMSTFT